MQNAQIIFFENVYKKYKKSNHYAVNNLVLKLEKGDFFALLGPNGAGKTTTLHMLIGSLKPTKGKIWIKGEDIQVNTNIKKIIGFVPAEPSFYPKNVTPNELFMLKKELIGINKEEMENFVLEKGEKYQAFYLFSKKINELSTGERQKIGFILAMLGKPEILVLDEAFSHIDSLSRKKIHEDLNEYRKKDKTTIIFSTHTLAELESYGEKIGILNKGRLIISMNKKELVEKYNPRVIDVTVKEKERFIEALKEEGLDFFLEDPIIHIKYTDLEATNKKIIKIIYENNITLFSLKPSQISLEKLITDFFEK